MDLVEIRKKAKKLKESKGKGKADTELADAVTQGEPSFEGDLSGKMDLQPETDVKDKGKKTSRVKPFVPADSEMEAEDEAAPLSLLSTEANSDDFLTGVLDALYQEECEAEEEEDDVVELLCFKLSGEEYAVDIHNVREIIKMMEITEVPKTPDFMLGIISLRGVIIPLLDLRMRLALEISEYTHKTRIIIAQAGDMKMGMVVDAVTEVVRLKKGIIEAPPSMLTNIDVDLLKGVGRHEDKLLIIPNLSRVFDVKI